MCISQIIKRAVFIQGALISLVMLGVSFFSHLYLNAFGYGACASLLISLIIEDITGSRFYPAVVARGMYRNNQEEVDAPTNG